MANTLRRRWVIEAKVVASTVATAAAAGAVAVLNDVQTNHELLGPMPSWLQALLLVVVPPIATFISGYQAKHTPRETDASTPSAPTGA